MKANSLEAIKLDGLGRFGRGFAEFIVSRYHLPRDWEHILGDERLFWRIRQNGKAYLQELPPGGTYWLRADGEHDLPPWQVFIVPDGRRERAFTNFRGPLPDDAVQGERAGAYECRWDLERARFRVDQDGLRVETELGVAASQPLALMRVTVSNTGRRRRQVTVMPRLVPWLTSSQPAAWDMPWLYQATQFESDSNSFRFEMRHPGGLPEKRRRLRWALDQRFDRLCLSESQFCGRGSREAPAAFSDWRRWVKRGDARVYGQHLFAALARTLTLAPGASWSCTMALGDDAEPAAAFASALAGPEREFETMRARKLEQLERFVIRTPDPAFTRYANEFLALQQQLVLRRGWPCNMMGVRDTAQDFTGAVAWYPEAARRMILAILETERSDGWFLRQFSTDGRHGRHDARPYVDSGLWVWELVYEYVCQTRDFALLDETVPFLDSDAPTSVRDHLERLLGYFMTPVNLGEHGLCKIREGDWNDSVNRAGLQGRGESVMASCHLIVCLRQAVRLSGFLETRGAAGFAEVHAFEPFAVSMRARIRRAALNRLGFLNGVFADNGSWFFSDRDPDGRTRFNMPVNAFGLIAGVFEPAEVKRLLARIRKLRRPYGYPLFDPAIGDPPMEGLGRIGSGDLMPGLGENGTCYNHGCHGFLARALAAVGEGDLCLDVMRCLFPYDQENHPVRQARSAPYAIVNVYLAAAGREGEGGDAFFSGTIDVAVRNVYQGLLGVHAEPDGLRITPCLPRAWRQVEGRIIYAGRALHIAASRKGRRMEVRVDGQVLNDGWYPAPGA